ANMKNMRTILSVAASAVLMASVVSAAETSSAASTGRPLRAAVRTERAGAVVRVPVSIDLAGVSVDTSPAVLGAYMLQVDFNPAVVRFTGARGGSTPQFSANPVFTPLETANANGMAKVLGLQPDL